MNKEFIPYEQALELKELGFDWWCLALYPHTYDEEIKQSLEFVSGITSKIKFEQSQFQTLAPLYQQAFRWFREKHNSDHFVQHHIDGLNQTYFSMTRKSTWDVTSHETYEEAELACLKKLIEIVKNK
jgi:hypothetical protein